MKELKSKQRAYLMKLASSLEPIFQIGKSSLTPECTAAIAEAFNTRELIKISVLKICFDDPREIAAIVAERTHSTVVQVIGKKIVHYKESKDHKKIELPLSQIFYPWIKAVAYEQNRYFRRHLQSDP